MPDQAALNSLHAHTRRLLGDAASEYGSGTLTARGFGDRVSVLLEDAHTHAAVLGRHRAGDLAPLETDDREFARVVVDGEAEFLHAFVKDLAGGRYSTEDGEDLGAIGRRAGLYAHRLTGTANEALFRSLDPEAIYWRLGASDHCGDCLELAARSPYTVKTIPTYPGQNATICIFSCHCSCETADGLEGFTVPQGDEPG
jgi:hypothetical protein